MAKIAFEIEPAQDRDASRIREIHQAAFGQNDEADLVEALLADPSAAPSLSLVARANGAVSGHVLFTRVVLPNGQRASILCPLAVAPEAQGTGVGTRLVRDGLERLRDAGTGYVFVLGSPEYYGRFGFGRSDELTAPYRLPREYDGAWQVVAFAPLPHLTGAIRCAKTLMDPKYWQ